MLDRESINFIFSRDFWRMSLLWTLSLLYSYLKLLIDNLCGRTITYPRLHPHASTRPVCIITGATSGLGAAAVKPFLDQGYIVILAGRSFPLLSMIVEELKQKEDVLLKEFVVDLTSVDSMLRFRESVRQWLLDSGLHPSIQLLINNAGILATSEAYTVDGYDRMIGTNYFGAFSLTNLLLPLLKNSYQPSRIVNVTSFTHRFISDLHISEKTLIAGDLQMVSRAADPGAVKTGIMREVPCPISQMAYKALELAGLLQSPEMGISSIIDAALAPPDASGRYFFGGGGRTIKSSALSYNKELAQRLWTCSSKLFKEKLCDLDEHSAAL